MQITLATSAGTEINLRSEMRMLKSALFYADSVRLLSLQATFLIANYGLLALAEEDDTDLLRSLIPLITADQEQANRSASTLDRMRIVRAKRGRTQAEQTAYVQFRAMLSQLRRQLEETLINKFHDDAQELLKAAKEGIIEIKKFSTVDSVEGMVSEYVREVVSTIGSGEVYPLFDGQTNEIVRAFVEAGTVGVSDIDQQRGRHVALASDLFRRLPSIDHLTISEIVDVRQELHSSLVRFRAEMISISKELTEATWNPDFEKEMDSLVLEKIQPIVVEIEERVAENSGLDALVSGFPVGIASTGAALITPILTQALDLSTLSSMTVLGAATLTTAGITNLVKASREQREIKKNGLYYYYQVGKM